MITRLDRVLSPAPLTRNNTPSFFPTDTPLINLRCPASLVACASLFFATPPHKPSGCRTKARSRRGGSLSAGVSPSDLTLFLTQKSRNRQRLSFFSIAVVLVRRGSHHQPAENSLAHHFHHSKSSTPSDPGVFGRVAAGRPSSPFLL